jgi:phosphoribosylformylglycinamidine synthase
MLGDTFDELGGSEYLAAIHGVVAGRPPRCDLEAEKNAIDALLGCIQAGVVASAHDCSDGGLSVAMAECCIARNDQAYGAEIDLGDAGSLSARAAFFAESQARFIVSSSSPARIEEIARKHGVPVARIGRVADPSHGLTIKAAGRTIRCDVAEMNVAYHDAIPGIMSAAAVSAELAEV